MTDMENDLALQLARELRNLLSEQNARLVLAESCTAGRVSATLACLPGISEWLCGCFVIYRNDSKSRWLGIPPSLLSDPEHGPVSRATTTLLAHQALAKTPEARFGLAVTGDVGPGAPAETDGVVFCALVDIGRNEWETCIHLEQPAPTTSEDVAARVARLDEATRAVLQFAIHSLSYGTK